MEELAALAREHKLTIVEDAAHALGATYSGRPVGSLSRFTAFSFQAIKHLTTGDGGALCCLEGQDFEEAKRRRWFGIDRERHLPSILGERQYDLQSLGFKYHLNDLAAAVGLGNLPDVPGIVARHREIAGEYRAAFGKVPGLKLLDSTTDRESSWWFFTVLAERRQDFVRALNDRGVVTSVVHQRIDRNRVFGGPYSDLVNQAYFDEHQIALPIHIGLTNEDVQQIVAAVQAGW
jgi:perosamine synthetase